MVQLHSSRSDAIGRRWERSPVTATHWLVCDSRTQIATLFDRGGVVQTWDDPLTALNWMQAFEMGREPDARWIGFLSYDLGRLFETIPSIATDDLGLPLFAFAWVETNDRERCGAPAPHPASPTGTGQRSIERVARSVVSSTFSRQAFERAVRRSLDYIAAGDIFQVNLAQRFTAGLRMPPREIWNRLTEKTPGEFGAYLDFGNFAMLSNSPELFLRVSADRSVLTRPIKGTRPRLPGMQEELRCSLKDQAELNMIVDLERNDLGRVCEIGSVKVTEPRVIEAHPTVYHGVATIEGTLRGDVSFVDLLRAAFPGGSITGAPKIRAMQIIEELEPVRRGPYCGAIGYITANGTMEFNVAIRTMIVKEGLVHIPVGGGIVADSDPQAEYEETMVKARAMFAAAGIARVDP
jgi:para-aminobenzoate synthetase component I